MIDGEVTPILRDPLDDKIMESAYLPAFDPLPADNTGSLKYADSARLDTRAMGILSRLPVAVVVLCLTNGASANV